MTLIDLQEFKKKNTQILESLEMVSRIRLTTLDPATKVLVTYPPETRTFAWCAFLIFPSYLGLAGPKTKYKLLFLNLTHFFVFFYYC